MHRRELERYYNDTCFEPLPPPPFYQPDETVSSYFHQKIVGILEHIENTGYAHNKDENFSLIPDFTELATAPPDTQYNLFLDCSGFVGYYVIQGLAEKLYQDVTPSNSSCQGRPLAADFADMIKNAPQVDDSHPAATITDLDQGEICWGKVKHVENIKHGDVIVYKHPENIKEHDRVCDGRLIYAVSGNTGHILFAHGELYKSNHCRASKYSCGIWAALFTRGDWQYVVEVADSTTSRHMDDSRRVNTTAEDGTSVDRSQYNDNTYHAWTAGAHGVVERCDDGSYRRNCSVYGSVAVEPIIINTSHSDIQQGSVPARCTSAPTEKVIAAATLRKMFSARMERKSFSSDAPSIVNKPDNCMSSRVHLQ